MLVAVFAGTSIMTCLWHLSTFLLDFCVVCAPSVLSSLRCRRGAHNRLDLFKVFVFTVSCRCCYCCRPASVSKNRCRRRRERRDGLFSKTTLFGSLLDAVCFDGVRPPATFGRLGAVQYCRYAWRQPSSDELGAIPSIRRPHPVFPLEGPFPFCCCCCCVVRRHFMGRSKKWRMCTGRLLTRREASRPVRNNKEKLNKKKKEIKRRNERKGKRGKKKRRRLGESLEPHAFRRPLPLWLSRDLFIKISRFETEMEQWGPRIGEVP